MGRRRRAETIADIRQLRPQRPITARPQARLRHLTDQILSHPLAELGVVILILAWVGALVGEHLLTDADALQMVWIFGNILHVFFVVELLLRFWVAPNKMRFFQAYYLDILAVIPMNWLRPLRLLRLLRIGALFRRSAGEMAVVAMLSLCFVLGSALLIDTHIESISLDFHDKAGSLWYALYTFVGGEPIGGMPTTEEGRLLTLGLMVGGMTLFGMFIGAVSASMATALSRRLEVADMEQPDILMDHLVVCGWNPAGPTMLRELFATRDGPRRVVVITEQPERPEDLHIEGVRPGFLHHICGDYTRVTVLEQANIRQAAMAILLTDTLTPRSDQDRDARTVLAALTIERLNERIFCCAELTSWEHAKLLKSAGVEEIVVRDWYAGVILGSMGRNWGLAAVLRDILSTSEGNAFHKIEVRPHQEGKTVGTLHTELKASQGLILIALERVQPTGERTIEVNPDAALTVGRGDLLVVIGRNTRSYR